VSKTVPGRVVCITDTNESARQGLSRLMDSASLRPKHCELPKRQKRVGHREPDYPFKFITERF
jgi:hypothetical protein